MTRKNIINVGLGLILVWLVVGVVKINNTTKTQDTKTTDTTSTESIEQGEAEGRIWLSPISQDLTANQNFDIEIVMDTAGKDVSTFNVYLDFDVTKINIDTAQGIDIKADSGRGFHKGSDAGEYIMMSNSEDVNDGHFRLAGIGVAKTANGAEERMVIIHAKTTDTFTSGKTELTLRVDEFSDKMGNAIATESNEGATITIK
jgi:hypothetical protein